MLLNPLSSSTKTIFLTTLLNTYELDAKLINFKMIHYYTFV